VAAAVDNVINVYQLTTLVESPIDPIYSNSNFSLQMQLSSNIVVAPWQ